LVGSNLFIEGERASVAQEQASVAFLVVLVFPPKSRSNLARNIALDPANNST